MARHDIDHQAARLAQRQHGAFSRTQLLELGASDRQIRERCRRGRFLELDCGVYGHPASPATWLRQAKAAELRFEEGAISGRPGAALYELGGVRRGSLEVSVPPGGGRGSRLARVRHRLVPVTEFEGIRVVTVEQVVADVAGLSDTTLLERVVEDALLRGLTTAEALAPWAERMSRERTKGAGLLRDVLEQQFGTHVPPANELERALYSVLDSPGFPPIERQAPFPWWPWAPQRVDAYVPAWRRIVEADGRAWHTRRVDFERDKWRDHLAQAHGIEVTRLTYRQLVQDPGYARSLLLRIGAHAPAA